MTARGITTFILVLVIIALGASAIFVFNKNKKAVDLANNPTTQNNSSDVKTQGTVMLGIKNTETKTGNISAIIVSVNKVEIHHQAQGWITVLNNPGDYDLLALKTTGATTLLTQVNMVAGTYDQIKFTVSKVMVVENGITTEAKLLAPEIKMTGTMIVEENKISTVVVDVLTQKSLQKTVNGRFVFAPVVKAQTQSNANVSVGANNQLTITSGNIDSDISAGMNINGEMIANFMLNFGIQLTEMGNVIKIGTLDEKDKTITINAESAINTAVNNKYLDSVTSVAFVTENGKKVWVISGWKNMAIISVYIDAMTGSVVNY